MRRLLLVVSGLGSFHDRAASELFPGAAFFESTMPIKPPIFRSRYQPAPKPDTRPSASRRFYGRDHSRWRREVLYRHPLCRRCELSGRIVSALIAHHLIEVTERPDLRLCIENGVGTCADCHNALHHGAADEVEKFRRLMEQKGIGVTAAARPGAEA